MVPWSPSTDIDQEILSCVHICTLDLRGLRIRVRLPRRVRPCLPSTGGRRPAPRPPGRPAGRWRPGRRRRSHTAMDKRDSALIIGYCDQGKMVTITPTG